MAEKLGKELRQLRFNARARDTSRLLSRDKLPKDKRSQINRFVRALLESSKIF